jgi:hypothetical protein
LTGFIWLKIRTLARFCDNDDLSAGGRRTMWNCIGQTGGHDFVRQNSSAYCRSVCRVLEGSTFKAPWACDLGATVRIRCVCDGSGWRVNRQIA